MTKGRKPSWFMEILKPKNYQKYFQYSSLKESTVASILKMLEDQYTLDHLDQDELERAMKEMVMSYKSHKGSAIHVFQKLLLFLKDTYGFYPDLQFPEMEVWNTFERQMYLAKELQAGDLKIQDLSDRLWVSTRTLEEDLKKLRGEDEDPIQILGRKFTIGEMGRKKGKVLFSSTMHPFFLTWNLTQVIASLKGLQRMMEDPLLKAYARKSAEDLWMQLSSYAKDRIIRVSEELLKEDADFYRSLESDDKDAFRIEKSFRSTDGPSVLMDCMKNDKVFFVEYLEEDDKVIFLAECRCIPGTYKGECLDVTTEGERRTLFFHRVLRSTYTKEEMY